MSDELPDLESHAVIGLAPALYLQESDVLKFEPFVLVGMSQVVERDPAAKKWIPIAEQYSQRREARRDGQVLVYLRKDFKSEPYRELVPAFWSLLVFAFTGWGRRCVVQPRGLAWPEAFFLPLFTPQAKRGVNASTGSMSDPACAYAELPLRWGVDRQYLLEPRNLDERIRFGCMRASRNPAELLENPAFRALGTAAGLVNSSMEYHQQKVEDGAAWTRRFVLLMSAYEALHRADESAADTRNHWHLVRAGCVERLRTGWPDLLQATLSGRSVEQGVVRQGHSRNPVEFLMEAMARCRNGLAHGRSDVPVEQMRLPREFGGQDVSRVSTLMLTILLGQDLLGLVNAPCRVTSLKEPCDYMGEPDFQLLLEANQRGFELDVELGKQLKNPYLARSEARAVGERQPR